MWCDGTVYEPSRIGPTTTEGAERQAQSAVLRSAALKRAAQKPFYSSLLRHRAAYSHPAR